MQASTGDSTMDSGRKIESKIEHEICNFYISVLKGTFNLHYQNFQDIRKSLSNIRRTIHQILNPEGILRDIVSFNKITDRLAYIFAYSFIHSAVMYDHFSSLLDCNPEMKEKIISMRKLRLCILGGGPGFGAVSICKIISILRKESDEPLFFKYYNNRCM